MKWTVTILVILGLFAALSAVVLVNLLRTDTSAEELALNVDVVKVTRPLPAMSVVTSGFIVKDNVLRADLPDGFLSDPTQAVGKVLAVSVVEGQVLSKHNFITEGTGAQLAAALPYGMRAVSVSVPASSAMSGLLYPGCVVDVLASFKLRSSEKGQAISTTLLRGVQVLAVQGVSIVSRPEEDKKKKSSKASSRSARNLTVTLMVDPKQAEALQLAKDNGRISLAMRNPLDRIPVDLNATILSQGRLAKLGTMLPAAVFASKRNRAWQASAGPNSIAGTAAVDGFKEGDARNQFFSEAFSDVRAWTESPQWEVTVIRGRKVTEEVIELSDNESDEVVEEESEKE